MRIRLPRLAILTLCGCAALAQAHGDEDHTPQAATAAPAVPAGVDATAPQRQPDGSVHVPKAVQRLYGLRTLLAERRALPGSVELKAQVIADPSASGRVQATQAGIVLADPGGLPHLGQRVRRGQVLAYLAPQANALERAGAQAALAELEGQRAVAEQTVQRHAQLEGSVPQKEIAAARAELDGLEKRRRALASALGARVAMAAPVSGVISSSSVLAGQVVEARELLFEIVQPDRLLVQAQAHDTRLLGNIEQASAITAAREPLRLRFLGASPQMREQAIALQFRIVPPQPALVVGQPVDVIVGTRSRIEGYALPQAALLRNAANETVVWVHEAPELFRPLKVRAQVLDATRAVVTSGLAGGERVVVQGAPLLAQVR